ncbi:MAG: hypothetical protein QOJ39_1186 [Candidatus Eremiobacteraeota bacterium]|nr:hypothetical protein [Candidatus Eremiobacteraeota bacterium]
MRADTAAPSVAALLDEVRPLVVGARVRGEAPSYLMLPPAAYDAVAACRVADRRLGLPMIVLGMEIVRSDDPAARPRVF